MTPIETLRAVHSAAETHRTDLQQLLLVLEDLRIRAEAEESHPFTHTALKFAKKHANFIKQKIDQLRVQQNQYARKAERLKHAATSDKQRAQASVMAASLYAMTDDIQQRIASYEETLHIRLINQSTKIDYEESKVTPMEKVKVDLSGLSDFTPES